MLAGLLCRREPGAIELGLVMTDTALFGTSDEPAHVDGYGPVPAELAREIVAGACSREERVWVRRLYADPTSGELVAMDSRPGCSAAGSAGSSACATGSAAHRGATHRSGIATMPGPPPTEARPAVTTARVCARRATTPSRHPGGEPDPRPAAGPHTIRDHDPTGHTYRSRRHRWSLTIRETHPARPDYVLAG